MVGIKLAASYCFPVVVTFCLLIRLKSIIKEFQKSGTVSIVLVACQGGVDYEETRRLVEGAYK
ncbi:YvrJ family protein [Desulfofundulus sp.]|uniref:YvrJ family protein n=1 Tax=Desulfofundulus sp. TaxID=2282750 RepID=UPI003C78C595